MIKYHPTLAFLQSFVQGELPASLSAAIAIHNEMCPKCQSKAEQLTQHLASECFEDISSHGFDGGKNHQAQHFDSDLNNDTDLDTILNCITDNNEIYVEKDTPDVSIQFDEECYQLPKALKNMSLGNTMQIGKLSRKRINLGENEIHTNLLHIAPGGSVPEHTHKGFELTVLLAGSFEDEEDKYVMGDFIMLDASNKHNPVSAEGCLCFTVANDALQFTKGINKLLNPIGSFIY
jgi:putative transcriptional regulator